MPLRDFRIRDNPNPNTQFYGDTYDDDWGGHDLTIEISDGRTPGNFYSWIECGDPIIVNLYNALGAYLAKKATERA